LLIQIKDVKICLFVYYLEEYYIIFSKIRQKKEIREL